MAYTAFNPINDIISAIGYSYDVDGDNIDESCVSFSYPDGDYKNDTCYVPLYTSDEARTGTLPYMPFIEVTLMTAPSRTRNIGGNIKLNEAYLDFHIYATNNDKIYRINTWMPKCKNEIIDRITQNRCSISSCTWVEATDTGRELIENTGKMVVFHHIVTCYAYGYDSGI